MSEEENEGKMEARLPLAVPRTRRRQQRGGETRNVALTQLTRAARGRGAETDGRARRAVPRLGPGASSLGVGCSFCVQVSAVRAVVREGHWRTTRHEDPGNHCHNHPLSPVFALPPSKPKTLYYSVKEFCLFKVPFYTNFNELSNCTLHRNEQNVLYIVRACHKKRFV